MIEAKVSREKINLIPSTRNELNLLKRCSRYWIISGKIPPIILDWELNNENLKIIKKILNEKRNKKANQE